MSIHIFTTGGTIDKVYFDANSEYKVGEPQIANILREANVTAAYEVTTLMQKDSLDMTDEDRALIARRVQEAESRHIVVTHGTDTMAFTASALSFMLHPLDKPVVFTGSQVPLAETRNDAQGNLLASLLLLGAHAERLTGVYVYFSDRLYRGNRVTKVNADAYAAFDSPNFPPVGTVGINIDVDWSLVPQPSRSVEKPEVTALGTATVSAFRLFPGLEANYLENVLAPPVQGVVLECFGSGNAPDQNQEFLDALDRATGRGVVVVATAQPLRGTADLGLYSTGRALGEVGVVSGYDMTTEAALAKLYYLIEQGYDAEEVRRLVQTNLRGELTPPDETPSSLGRTRRRLAGYR